MGLRSPSGERPETAGERDPAAATSRLAAIAHEVALPVALASEAAWLLREDVDRLAATLGGGDEMRPLLERIRAQADAIGRGLERAERLLGSFQRSASRESHGAGPVRMRLAAVVRDAVATVEPFLWKRKLRAELRVTGDTPEAPLEARADETALVEVVLNLVVNAARHAYQGSAAGRVEVEVARAPADATEVTLTVRDFGRGIAPQDLARIFEPGFTTGAALGGQGLGLGIVRDLVERRLRGSITCESAPGRGTAFVVRFPLA